MQSQFPDSPKKKRKKNEGKKKGMKCECEWVGRSFEFREGESTGGGTKKGEKVLDLVFREEGQNWVYRKKMYGYFFF